MTKRRHGQKLQALLFSDSVVHDKAVLACLAAVTGIMEGLQWMLVRLADELEAVTPRKTARQGGVAGLSSGLRQIVREQIGPGVAALVALLHERGSEPEPVSMPGAEG